MDLAERKSIEPLLDGLQEFKSSRRKWAPTTCVVASSDEDRLCRNLSASPGALMVRRVLEHIGCDEDLPFRWKLDHKLVQNLILSEYIPGMLPETTGLVRGSTQAGHMPVATYFKGLWRNGFVIKSSRGSTSERAAVLESGETMLETSPQATILLESGDTKREAVPLATVLNLYDGTPESELFIIQEKIQTIREFKVHTIGRSVIRTLTFCTFGASPTKPRAEEQAHVESFVEEALEKLPDGLCDNLLCAWDIGINASRGHYIFEINYAGNYPRCRSGIQCNGSPYNDQLDVRSNHPLCRPGFQCSGMLQQYHRNIAYFLAFVSEEYKVTFEFAHTLTPMTSLQASWAVQIKGVKRWARLLRVCNEILELWRDTNLIDPLDNLSLRETIYANRSGLSDRVYMEYVDWLRKLTDEIR
jgi:hypothetical protein